MARVSFFHVNGGAFFQQEVDKETVCKLMEHAHENYPIVLGSRTWLVKDWNANFSSRAGLEYEFKLQEVTTANQREDADTMNNSTTVFIVDDTIRALRGIWEDGGKVEVFKTFDQSIKKDDLCVTTSETRHGFSVVKITETDVVIDIDDPNLKVRWIVSKIDTADHKATLAQELVVIDKVRKAEFNKKRKDLVNHMAGEDAAALRSLTANPAAVNQSAQDYAEEEPKPQPAPAPETFGKQG
jgi:hypothetical protein